MISVNSGTAWIVQKFKKSIQCIIFAVNKGKEDVSMISFTCSSCKTAPTTIGDLINDLHTLKNDISKRIVDKAIEIKTHLWVQNRRSPTCKMAPVEYCQCTGP